MSKGQHLTIKHNGQTKLAHRVLVERILGRPLPPKAVVHHIDENPRNNSPSNFVVCQNDAYHKLLHVRMMALKATGDPSKRRCVHCQGWDDPKNMRRAQRRMFHNRCAAAYKAVLKRRNGWVTKLKLDHEKAAAIRNRLVAGETRRDLATEYGVTDIMIGYIARGECWRQRGETNGKTQDSAAPLQTE